MGRSLATAKAVGLLVLVLFFGQRVMRTWFFYVARQKSAELFMLNREPLLSELDSLLMRLSEYRDALGAGDATAMRALLAAGREQKLEADRKDYHA